MATKREHVDALKALRDEMNDLAGSVIYAYRNDYAVSEKDITDLRTAATVFANRAKAAVEERKPRP